MHGKRWLRVALASALLAGYSVTQADEQSGHVAPAAPLYTMPDMAYAQMRSAMQMDDQSRVARAVIDELEFRDTNVTRAGVWDAQARYGDDYDKAVLRTEGEWPSGTSAAGRADLLWDRVISRWWSLQAGARYDFGDGPGRGWVALGVAGVLPYWVDVEATLYAGQSGALAARVKAETDVRFTQRLVLQPEAEFNAYSRADAPRDQGAGLTDLQAGMRLRYAIRREIAPYLGVAWARRNRSEVPNSLQWAAGVRMLF